MNLVMQQAQVEIISHTFKRSHYLFCFLQSLVYSLVLGHFGSFTVTSSAPSRGFVYALQTGISETDLEGLQFNLEVHYFLL